MLDLKEDCLKMNQGDKSCWLSMCIPTNGIIEWVFPVLNSIYSQGVNNDLFEVVVTDNGDNEEFHNQMLQYASEHENLIYKKTSVYMFENQLEAVAIANGQYIKFLNHRAVLVTGALQRLIDFVKNNINSKPVCYFSNGELKFAKGDAIRHYKSFDEFIRGLKRYVSWTTGVGIWKEDYEKIPKPVVFDKISPHSVLMLSERKKTDYIIDDILFSKELNHDDSKKGKYDLFKAFAVEEISIIFRLYIDGDISAQTFKIVRDDYKKMCIDLYRGYCILKKPCSYILTGFDDAMGFFMTKREVVGKAWAGVPLRAIKKIVKSLLGKDNSK